MNKFTKVATNKPMTINISTSTLVKILFALLLLAFMFYIRNILLIIFMALIISSALDPWVDWLQKHKIPRSAGILSLFVLLVVIIGGVIYLIIPPITTEVNQLAENFPVYWQKISNSFTSVQAYTAAHGWSSNIENSLKMLQSNIGAAAGNVFDLVFSFFGGVASLIIVLVITFYMTVEEQAIKRAARALMPVKYQPYFTHLVNRIQEKIGFWLRGQLVLSLIIFAMVFIGLTAFGVKYALVLALFAGVVEIIPYLGPMLGLVPAVFIAFMQSPTLGVLVIILFLLIQFLENHLIVPKVMQRAVGLNPVVIIIAMLIGAKIAGVLGIVLAVPVATALSVIMGDFVEMKNED